VNLLLDSHTLLWSYFDSSKLSGAARTELTNTANRVFVSAASHWEIAIKVSTGKLTLAEPFLDFVQPAILDNGFTILPIEPRHTVQIISLPNHHRDPFDRLLICQAIVEAMPILGADPVFDLYPIKRLW
jgi:PIN domain nuclease of toxin-antitoxin system